MWDSGYVVVPTANGCCMNITLQVDPKVGQTRQLCLEENHRPHIADAAVARQAAKCPDSLAQGTFGMA